MEVIKFYTILKDGFLLRDHPDSIKIENYYEPYIYCISTESKRINIDNYKFLDWDDIEPIDVIKLKNLDYLHTYSPLSDIHRYLESGIDGNSLIELEDGNESKIKILKLMMFYVVEKELLQKLKLIPKIFLM